MSPTSIDDFGPVDYLVVESRRRRPTSMARWPKELASLVEVELIQSLDLDLVRKREYGSIEALEIDDLDEVDELSRIETQIAEILAADAQSGQAAPPRWLPLRRSGAKSGWCRQRGDSVLG